jgi:hypothetical protein
MQDELQSFLESPTARHYRRLRAALLEERDEQPQSAFDDRLQTLTDLFLTGDHAAVLDLSQDMQPAWSMSPRVHFLAAQAAERLDDQPLAELERFCFQACLEGILATGDGTAEAPYCVTYLSDQYDVLSALGLEKRSQSLVDRRGMLCDVVKCTDGAEIWFELTGLLDDPRLTRRDFALRQHS